MEKRTLKNGELSLLGFGLMRLPCREGSQEIDSEAAGEMVDYAIAQGVNYFDTAYMYHEGKSESFAGEALSRHERSSYKLATKMPLVALKTHSDVERIFNEQLKKCKTDYFDFYLLHNINEDHLRIAESCGVYEQLKKKQEQGLIGHLGFSFHDRPELLRKVVEKYDWEFAQIQLNYLDWELQNAGEQYEILADKGIPVNVMEPVRGGTLAKLCDESIRIFREADPNASAASWALRYAASLPDVQVVLSGMSVLDQVKDNVRTMSPFTPLTGAEYSVIEKALAAYRRAASVPCTSCRYCMDCPSGVEIPKNLAVYNNYQIALANKHPMAPFLFEMEYHILQEGQHASSCVSCAQCKSRCPQHIDIPRWMGEISKLHENLRSAHR
ncbi:MAG: aldo/keto reductase [Spirochaetaceae bacterium]|jgi:predicted aldo/keto reductase-like oxidoreductase|nr:aldo/keto reductase [Spirochaetaceae bacterium]